MHFSGHGAGYVHFPLSSDQFIGLYTPIVIGRSEYFGFGFTTPLH